MGDDPTPEQGPAPDPFENLTLDESFVNSASITEPAAIERERAARARADREANLQRMLADEAAGREHARYEQYRYAPGEWDDVFDEDPHRERPAGRGRTVRIVAVLVLVAVFVVYGISQFISRRDTQVRTPTSLERTTSEDQVASAGPSDPRVEVVRPTNWPPASTEASTKPLGVPAPVIGDGGAHTFLQVQPDGETPVAYDPCRPIHYVTRPGGPAEGKVLVRESIAAVSAATGLRFVDDGTTQEGPSDSRSPYQPEVYGERWAPVLFTWSDPVESPRLGEITPEAPQANPAAYAGSIAVGLPEAGDTGEPPMVFVSGAVTLDAADLTRMAESQDGRARARAVIQHEIAHLVGLGHVEDDTQLMYPTINSNITGFNDGDLEGLAALGKGACFPQI